MFLLFLASTAQATIYVNLDLESSTVNAAITNGSTHDGSSIELFSGDPAYPTPFTRNAITTPSGSRYHEVLTICGGYSGGRCTPANDPTVTTNQAGFVAHHTGIDWTTKDGQTFYLGGFFRFDRVGGRNVWASSNSFDKLWEFGGNGPDHSLRWGIGAGRHGNFTSWDSADTFTFDIWCADTVFDACEVPASLDWDHKPANANGYSASNPYECSFERWYAVVIAVTVSATGTGRIQEWINGTQIYDSAHITRDTGIVSSDGSILHGTIAQGAYDAPDHYRRSDKLMLTDSLTDITNAGLMSDPEAGGGRVTMFIGQGAAAVLAGFQYLMILSYLWERRQKAIQAVMAVHAWYWTVRYRQALRRWQREAPIMLEHQGETIELAKQEQQAWQLRK
jgi:hypothetical protein